MWVIFGCHVPPRKSVACEQALLFGEKNIKEREGKGGGGGGGVGDQRPVHRLANQ